MTKGPPNSRIDLSAFLSSFLLIGAKGFETLACLPHANPLCPPLSICALRKLTAHLPPLPQFTELMELNLDCGLGELIGLLHRSNAILSLLHPSTSVGPLCDRECDWEALSLAISHPHTGRSSQPPRSKPP